MSKQKFIAVTEEELQLLEKRLEESQATVRRLVDVLSEVVVLADSEDYTSSPEAKQLAKILGVCLPVLLN